MECPQCHGLSVIIKDGTKKCQATGCTYMSFHVISYENQIRQFQGQKGAENRFSMLAGNGANKQKESRAQRNFHASSKVIRVLASAMKLSDNIVDKAQAKLIQIMQLKYPQNQIVSEQQDEQKQRYKYKINVSNPKIAAYVLYAACFDKKMFFKDVRIANEMQITRQEWNSMVKYLNSKLKDIMTVPFLNLEHYVLRICVKRKIRDIQKNAMMQMVRRVKQAEIVGGNRPNTIAACIFWQIMIRSSYYNKDGSFDMKNYLKGGRPQQDRQKYWTQKHFQASYEAIKKFRNQFISPKLNRLIPQFQGRIEQNPINKQA